MNILNREVGKKIKNLRKKLNMTQADLAGEEMTKSMLSQIENGVSNPSIKTLQYIADRLNMPVSYFLEDREEIISKSDQESYERIKHISELIDLGNLDEAQDETEKFLKDDIDVTNTKARADILLKLGNALINLNNTETGKKYVDLSIQAYTHGNFYMEGAKAYTTLGRGFYQEFKYKESLDLCDKALNLYHKSINKDILFEIELYYYKILILFAVGDVKDAVKSIRTAMNISSETSIYYKADDFYRLNAVSNYLIGNIHEFEKSLEKAIQFAEFAEDKMCLMRIYAIKGLAALESNDAEKALEYAGMSRNYAEKDIYIHYLIRGRAYYILGEYRTAYENIIKVVYPSYEKHKYDYLNMWSSKIYEGLILNKLGKQAEAIEAVKMGIEKMALLGYSRFLVNAYKSMSEIYSDMHDFENAFIYLKKADEIQDIINKDDNIIF